MEHDDSDALRDAIQALDEDNVSTLLESDGAPALLTANDGELIQFAYRSMDDARSAQNYDIARRILFMLLAAVGKARKNGKIGPGVDLGLEDFLAGTIISDDAELAERLLEAGANPDGRLTFDNQPLLAFAVRRRKLKIVRHLLQYGANPEVLAREGETVFGTLVATGCSEIAWVVLFYSVLGDASDKLFQAFKGGYPDGSMEAAVENANLTNRQARDLFRAMLAAGAAHAAVAVAVGYCRSIQVDPESTKGEAILQDLFTGKCAHDTALTLGNIIHGLAEAGFDVSGLSPSQQNRTLCQSIQDQTEERVISLIEDLGVEPLIWTVRDTEPGYICEALTLAEEQRMYPVIALILENDFLPIGLRSRKVVQLLNQNDPVLLTVYAADLCSYPHYSRTFMQAAIDRNHAPFLATLIKCGCSPAFAMAWREITEENFTTSLLASACSQEIIDVDETDSRFDCASVLVLSLAGVMDELPDLCDLIILDRAEAADVDAVYFLCSLGFPPLLLLEAFRDEWTAETDNAERKLKLANAVMGACCGLIDFIDTVQGWKSRVMAGEALGCLIPGFGNCGGVQSAKALLTFLDENGDVAEAVDASLVETVWSIKSLDISGADEALAAIDDLVVAIDRLMGTFASSPSLLELSANASLEVLTARHFQEIGNILTTIRPAFMWQELIDRLDDAPLDIIQLVVMDQLQEYEPLAELVFTDEPFFIDFDTSSTDDSSSE